MQEAVPGSVTDLATQNMRDTHQVIIHDAGEMICRISVLLDDYKVIIPETRASYLTKDQIWR